MVLKPVCCPHCGSDQVRKHGKNERGAQRYRCRNASCERSTFLREYANQACRPGVKAQVIEMTLNGSGIRDVARVLHISPVTVIATLKKKNPNSNPSIPNG